VVESVLEKKIFAKAKVRTSPKIAKRTFLLFIF